MMQASLPDRPTTPLVSIITVVYNACEDLKSVLESVFPHRGPEVELIVVDGGSKDGTVTYLTENSDRIDFWMSEPDRGIYDAMNKAISHARGTYLLHLNAGDRLMDIPFVELREGAANNLDILSFRVALDSGKFFTPAYGSSLTITNTLHHQGTFFRKAAFPEYSPRFKIFADFDVNQRMALAGSKARIFSAVVAYHATDGISNQNNAKAATEFFQVIRGNHGWKVLPAAWLLCKWQGVCRRLGL